MNVTQRLLEACRGRRLRRFVYASSSSIYGESERPADAGGRAPAADLALRRDEARGGAPGAALLGAARRADGVAALLHGGGAAAAARHGVPQVRPRDAGRAADHGLRRRRADARLHLRRRRGRGERSRRRDAARTGRCTTSGAGAG